MAFFNLTDYRLVLAFFVLIYLILVVDSCNGLVGRYLYNVKGINLSEFGFFCHSRTCHTGQLIVQSEKVLECNSSERLALVLNLYAFLCLNSLVQSLVESTSEHKTSGKFINDYYFAVLYNIVNVTLHYTYRLDSLVDMV